MTPAQLRSLMTLPKVIEAVRAFQAESNELMGLLGHGLPPPAPTFAGFTPGSREALAAMEAPRLPPSGFRDVLRATDEAEARAAAEAELARRQAEATPEQKEAEDFLRSQEAPRKALLNAALGIGP